MGEVYETIIIGGGIAGIAASIYASRKRMKFLFLSSDFGGQINVSGEIENYPGIKSTNNVEFAQKLQEQLDYNNVKITYENVKAVEKSNSNFRVATDKNVYETQTVIVASGARARKLQVPGEDDFAGKGVTYCAICDGPLYKDKTVAIIGGGDSALEAIDFMKKIAKKIYVIAKYKVKGHEYLMERIRGLPNVEIIEDADTTEIFGGKFVTGLKYKKDNEEKELAIEGIFIEVGRVPNSEMVRNLVEVEEPHGHIKVNKHAETSVPGVFAAGDCADLHAYQYVIAAGQAVTALLSAAKYLQTKKD